MILLISYALTLAGEQVNNYAFNIGADPKKLAIHGTTATTVGLITTPIFTVLTALAGAACVGTLTAITSMNQVHGAIFGAGLGAIVGMSAAQLISMNIAQSILVSSKTPSITNKEAFSLAKIRIAEGTLGLLVGGGLLLVSRS